MKKLLALVFMATSLVFASSCSDDEQSENEKLIVGTWTINTVEVNGNNQTQNLPSVEVTIKSDGKGTIDMGNEYSFTWKISGDKLNITNPGGQVINCTIVELTSKKCTLKSKNMSFPIVGDIDGETTIRMTKK